MENEDKSFIVVYLIHGLILSFIIFLTISFKENILYILKAIEWHFNLLLSLTIGIVNFHNILISIFMGYILVLLIYSFLDDATNQENQLSIPDEFTEKEEEYTKRYYKAFPELKKD
jgi:uncharacterized BrkB/YihY/UPF0761 family membrane protein